MKNNRLKGHRRQLKLQHIIMVSVLVIGYVLLGSCNQFVAQIPVSPGMSGFGTKTLAGRGGEIIKVLNLRDSGPGSFRSAVNYAGPRIIVFEVSGSILLEDDIEIVSPFVTIAGQTAPSPGITLVGAGIRIETHDVLVQHIRIRVGDSEHGPPPDNRDALQVLGPYAFNVVVDHISASWAIDENMSTWGSVKDVTFSHCIISEALNRSLHSKGSHSKGLLIGDHSDRVFIKGNLFAHNFDRNPQIKGGSTAIILNNVSYNAGNNAFVSMTDNYAQQPHTLSIVGNILLNGPDTPDHAVGIKVEGSAKSGTRVYVSNNKATGQVFKNSSHFNPLVPEPPVWIEEVQSLTNSQTLEQTLTYSGARPVDRDSVDKRIVADVLNRQGRIIDSQKQVGGWPEMVHKIRYFEIPEDPHGDDNSDGYSNIEEVLQSMARDVEGRGENDMAL